MASGGTERSHGSRRGRMQGPVGPPGSPATKPKTKLTPGAWEEARGLIWVHRYRLGLGLALMVVNRLAGLVLPFTSKYLMDDVIIKKNWDLLPFLAMAAAAA